MLIIADPKFTTLNAIANTLKMNVADLFSDIHLQTDTALSDATKNCIILMENMPKNIQEMAIKQIKILSELTD